MKKLILLSTALFFSAAFARAEFSRADYVTRVETCEAVLQEMQFHPETAVPPQVFKQAKGLVIVHQVKAGFIVGYKGGYAVALVRKPDGSWSIPGLLHAGELSVGLQLGGQGIDTIFVLMDDASVRLLFRNRFNFGVDANAVGGPKAKDIENSTNLLKHPVLVYTSSSGLYAGATVKSSYLTPNEGANHILYGTSYNLPELLFGSIVSPPPEVGPLVNYVTQLGAGK